ncbi:MAG: hypothetical protein J3Q66DRAFT_343841, partial [Benniella sp.]
FFFFFFFFQPLGPSWTGSPEPSVFVRFDGRNVGSKNIGSKFLLDREIGLRAGLNMRSLGVCMNKKSTRASPVSKRH